MNFKTLLTAASIAFAIGGVATTASADTPWQNHHPRREEVNTRLDRQAMRIRNERANGDIGALRAARLHAADERLRMEERRFAFHHNGHLTRAEQWRLNQQENRISHRIG
ncbi:MAG TPA: hypothetical protein VKU90_12575 [Caulobacteraceae bacterium]|nr:hypothetical protein [Caulobacteraceae bacterium]